MFANQMEIECGQVFYNACDLDTLYQVVRVRGDKVAFATATGNPFWVERTSDFFVCLQPSIRKVVR